MAFAHFGVGRSMGAAKSGPLPESFCVSLGEQVINQRSRHRAFTRNGCLPGSDAVEHRAYKVVDSGLVVGGGIVADTVGYYRAHRHSLVAHKPA